MPLDAAIPLPRLAHPSTMVRQLPGFPKLHPAIRLSRRRRDFLFGAVNRSLCITLARTGDPLKPAFGLSGPPVVCSQVNNAHAQLKILASLFACSPSRSKARRTAAKDSERGKM